MFEAAIFDVGEVLHTYDPGPRKDDIRDTLEITQAQFDACWNPLTIALEVGQITEEEYWQKFKEQTGSKVELPEESLLVRKYREGVAIKHDTLEIVQALDEKGLKLAILSNAILPHARHNTGLGTYDRFPVRMFSYEVGFRKP